MREEVTHNQCHPSMRRLFDASKASINRTKAHPEKIRNRLWPKSELDPESEKLLLSDWLTLEENPLPFRLLVNHFP